MRHSLIPQVLLVTLVQSIESDDEGLDDEEVDLVESDSHLRR